MRPALQDNRRWMREGTDSFLHVLSGLADTAWERPTQLEGWTRRHLVAHVAANADAIGNLVRWAATGIETPMYRSANDRAEGIAKGDQLAPEELVSWVKQSASELEFAMAELEEARWQQLVVTAQGRTVPASETPWMRSREVMVHAVDLDGGVSFADLPEDFLTALREDIETKRGDVPVVIGDLAEVVSYLAGRPYRGVRTPTGDPAPALGPWL